MLPTGVMLGSTQSRILTSYSILREDWSLLNYGEGGGGHVKFYPYEKGGGGEVLAMLKGGHKKFRVVFTL